MRKAKTFLGFAAATAVLAWLNGFGFSEDAFSSDAFLVVAVIGVLWGFILFKNRE
jgi:hypothetical protein